MPVPREATRERTAKAKTRRVSQAMSISAGWAVSLTGDQIDIDDLREMLASPFDPWIDILTEGDVAKPLLRTKSWASLTSAAEVIVDAQRILRLLHGMALLIYGDARLVQTHDVMKLDAAGKRQPIIFAAAGHARIRGVRARGRAGPAPSSAESTMQKWLREADSDDTRMELYRHLSLADNWYDLYKVAELARRLGVAGLLGRDKGEWDRFWQTANCHRHAPNPAKFPLPSPPMELDEARVLVPRIVSRLLV